VVFRSGAGTEEQKAGVKRRPLNPVWNERLSLTVAGLDAPATFEVYDHDAFTVADLLGVGDLPLDALGDGEAPTFELPLLDRRGRAVHGNKSRLSRIRVTAQYHALQ